MIILTIRIAAKWWDTRNKRGKSVRVIPSPIVCMLSSSPLGEGILSHTDQYYIGFNKNAMISPDNRGRNFFLFVLTPKILIKHLP